MLISVIVPVYNVSPYLTRCLDSIVTQTFREYDVILIDDGSTDGSGDLCDQYAARYAQIHVIHQRNGGLSAARNTGIEWARKNSDSQYLTFVDSDDWVHPDYLNYLYQAILQTGCGISVCRFDKVKDDHSLPQAYPLQCETIDPEKFYMQGAVNFITAWGKLYSKRLFAELRFPVGKIHEDEFVTWRMLLIENQIALVNNKLYLYYVRNDSITGLPWNENRLVVFDALEEQNRWIDEHCSKELQEYIRKRKARTCAEQIRSMRLAKAPHTIIQSYRRKLIVYIRDARPSLRFRENYFVYSTAWPLISGSVRLAYKVCKKLVSWIA